ncbi:DUF2514 family protein [Pseudomonas sp. MYb185]|uniref:DUF2514 family protein n=1 Tax=Pseudomonas sp. MYb185 TaxID=1848729 RepID=UPI000CFA8A63|nr:DUF2514 family protein [Pseudomonas sp. MYb185]PRB80538.1 hypothetical protein CQ007_12530 [Pseudomonas sp. MYb185]
MISQYTLYAKLAALAGVAALLVALGWQLNGWRLSGQIQTVKTEFAEYRATVKAAGERAQADVRTTEQAWQSKIEKVRTDANQQLTETEQRVADANAVALRLRKQLEHLSTRLTENPTTPPGSQAAPATCGMLTELLAETDRLAGVYAEASDRSRVAGEACVAGYEALLP